MALNAHNKM